MYRSDDWVEGFYIDNHKKYECCNCEKEFIVGEELLNDCTPGFPVCPYCGQSSVECTSWTEDDQLEELSSDMGCLAIYVEDEPGGSRTGGDYLNDYNDESLEALAKGTAEAFKKKDIDIGDAYIISTELAKTGIEIAEVDCKHKVNGICKLGIKTWCSNCKKQNWSKYEPRENEI